MNDRCPVCGGELTPQLTACSSCPLHSGCDMIGCENCGYHTVAPRSSLVDLFKRLGARWKRHEHGSPRVS